MTFRPEQSGEPIDILGNTMPTEPIQKADCPMLFSGDILPSEAAQLADFSLDTLPPHLQEVRISTLDEARQAEADGDFTWAGALQSTADSPAALQVYVDTLAELRSRLPGDASEPA